MINFVVFCGLMKIITEFDFSIFARLHSFENSDVRS